MVPRSLAAIIVVLLALPMGCATHSYAPATAAATREVKIKVGDEVRVVTTRRERISFRVTEVRSDRFVGVRSGRFEKVSSEPYGGLVRSEPIGGLTYRPPPKDLRPAGETVEVPYDELAVLQVRRFDGRTAALVTVAAIVTVGAGAAVIHALGPGGVIAAPPP